MAGKDIERFSLWARQELQTQVELRAAYYGICDGADASAWEVCGRTLSTLEHAQRASLVAQVQARGYAAVMEEATYTWFNRLVALRFMDANGYLECGASWFSTPGQAGFRPEVLVRAQELNLPGLDEAVVDNYRCADDEEGLYRYLFDLQCSALSHALPRMFSPLEDWTQLLCPANLLRETGVLSRMVQDIPEEDWRREVEIVGWMYQHYNAARKAEVMEGTRSGKKIHPEDIAPATQLFTPDWIVRYMVQNSLGRLWLANHPLCSLAEKMEFYVAPERVPADSLRVQSPEELRVCDPACGSGHVLTYAFDLLYEIYEGEGYAAADIPSLILRHNLYGMDLDQRAGDLAYFALMMKARARDRRFLRRGVQPHICVLQPIRFGCEELAAYREAVGPDTLPPEAEHALREFEQADNFGSLICPSLPDVAALRQRLQAMPLPPQLSLQLTHVKVLGVLKQADYLSQKYHVVVANPPYISSNKMNPALRDWVRTHDEAGKEDLFSAFMLRNMKLALPGGQLGFMTPFVWMFLPSYEKIREIIFREETLTSLVQLEYSAFAEATVPICAFSLENRCIPGFRGGFIRLSDFRGSEVQAPRTREALQNPDCGWFYRVDPGAFQSIPGKPIAYWLTENARQLFVTCRPLGDVADSRQGLATADNKRFLRLWHEVPHAHIGFGLPSAVAAAQTGLKWFPHNKGGEFRKWYGNLQYVVNWQDDGAEIRNFRDARTGKQLSRPQNVGYYFKPAVSWSEITSSINSFRYYPQGSIFNARGMCAFAGEESWQLSLLAFLNTSFVQTITKVINPSISFGAGDFAKLPYAERFWSPEASARAARLVELARQDWDSHETSWDFTTLPLLRAEHRRPTLAETYAALRAHWQQLTEETARLEKENNQAFLELYGLEREFSSEVALEQISLTCNPAYRYGADKSAAEQETLLRADTVRELLSFAVGCMFGRYSLTTPGVVCAGAAMEPERYGEFRPDADNILPICDEDYFSDDVCGRLVDFVRLVFGDEALEENLAFIAESLGGGRGAARDIIRDYFLKSFYADHCRMYGKRPIYWQFDSGRREAFRALVYLHRYDQDTLARMRTDYVFRQQERCRIALGDLRRRREEAGGRERTALTQRLNKISAQETEMAAFEQQLHHLANQRIVLDLDDGVVANYARFSPLLSKIR